MTVSHILADESRPLCRVTFANIPSAAGTARQDIAPPGRFCLSPLAGRRKSCCWSVCVNFSVLRRAPASVPLTGAEPGHLVGKGAPSLSPRRRPLRRRDISPPCLSLVLSSHRLSAAAAIKQRWVTRLKRHASSPGFVKSGEHPTAAAASQGDTNTLRAATYQSQPCSSLPTQRHRVDLKICQKAKMLQLAARCRTAHLHLKKKKKIKMIGKCERLLSIWA